MHKFDIKYTLDDYYEYYKHIMFRQRLVRDFLFFAIFVAVGIYWLASGQEGIWIPIFAFSMAVIVPCMTFIYIPLIKNQLKKRQDDIDRTHIVVTFNDDEVFYENQTVKPEEKKEEPKQEEKPQEVPQEKQTEEAAKEEVVEEVKEETPAEKKKEETSDEPKEIKKEDENIFRLKYENFLIVKETKNLFLFHLDRQTVIIIPKKTYLQGEDLSNFKSFVLEHVNPRRVRFTK